MAYTLKRCMVLIFYRWKATKINWLFAVKTTSKCIKVIFTAFISETTIASFAITICLFALTNKILTKSEQSNPHTKIKLLYILHSNSEQLNYTMARKENMVSDHKKVLKKSSYNVCKLYCSNFLLKSFVVYGCSCCHYSQYRTLSCSLKLASNIQIIKISHY